MLIDAAILRFLTSGTDYDRRERESRACKGGSEFRGGAWQVCLLDCGHDGPHYLLDDLRRDLSESVMAPKMSTRDFRAALDRAADPALDRELAALAYERLLERT